MKDFAFTGWTDVFNDGSGNIPAGGRAAYLDTITDNSPLFAGQPNESTLIPAQPTISYTGAASFPVDGITFQSSAFNDPQGSNTFGAMEWRIGEITDPTAPAYNPNAERLYEIVPVWMSDIITTPGTDIAIPGTVLRAGHTYRARVRHRDNSGRWGHWSAPVQFTAGVSDYLAILKSSLVVSELMYHPSAPTANESGYLEGDFEYVELRNVSPALTLDLTNVRFTKGVDFNFANSSIVSLAPGATVLVVKNIAAFNLRYGAGKPIAGAWNTSDNLSNSGEQFKVSYGAGAAIQDFVYDDAAPWPVKADSGGFSLVLRNPESLPDHTVAANWRASYVPGGTPGGDDRTRFDAWARLHGVLDAAADDEGDGISALLEYALRGNPAGTDRGILPKGILASVTVNGVSGQYLTLTFRRLLGAEDLAYVPEFSQNLTNWSANGVLLNSVDQNDGSVIETWRAAAPAGAAPTFGRLRINRL